MLEGKFRFFPQKIIIDPAAKFLVRVFGALNPNIITMFAVLSGTLVPLCLANGYIKLSLVLLWGSGFFDMLDGSIARYQNNTSSIGTVYDIVADRVVEFSVLLGLYFINQDQGLFIILMLGSILICVTTFLVVGIMTENQSNKGFHYSEGLMERVEAFIFFSLMIILPEFFKELSVVFIALVLYTAVTRILEFVQSQKPV